MTQDEPLTFGDLLRRHRIFASMSQEELAARAGLSARAISDLERGVKRTPRRNTLRLLVEALQLTDEDRDSFITAAREPATRPPSRRAWPPESNAASMPGAAAHPLQSAAPVGGFLGAVPDGSLVGREAEFATILALLDSVAAGSGRLVVIAGEPGIGKTRLAQAECTANHPQGEAPHLTWRRRKRRRVQGE